MSSPEFLNLEAFLAETKTEALHKIIHTSKTIDDVNFFRGIVVGIDNILTLRVELEKVNADLVVKSKEQNSGI